MKYIFVAGAPGSKWSSVCKNISYALAMCGNDLFDSDTKTNRPKPP